MDYTLPGTSGNLREVTEVLSRRLPASDGRVSYQYEAYSFHCLSSASLLFVCLTSDGFSRAAAFQFLADVRQRFFACYLPQLQSQAAASPAPAASSSSPSAPPSLPSSFSIPLSLQSDFAPELSRLLHAYSSRSPRMQRMRDDIAVTQQHLTDSLDLALERGERLELLEVKTQHLDDQALRFKKGSWQLARGLWWSNMRLAAIAGTAAVAGVYLLMATACGGLSLPAC